jgi:hypothetical protein
VKAFQRAFRGLALPKQASRAIMSANVEKLSA